MTRIFTDGAEFGDLLFWSSTGAFTTADSGTKRSGAYSYKVADTPMQKNITALAEGYLRFGVRFTNVLNANNFVYLRKGTTILAALRFNAGKQIEAYSGNVATLLHTSTTVMLVDTWYLMEWHYKLDNASGVSTLKINGLSEGTFSGDTQPGADTTFDRIDFLNSASQYNFYDDLALNDTDNSDGKNDNSWCGDGRVELLSPTGDDAGFTNQWTGSDGNSTDNWQLVDEIPPSSADYVEDSTAGHKDKYEVTDFTGTDKVILRVWVEARALDTVPEGAQMKLGVRVSASDSMSAAITLSSVYTAIYGDNYIVNPEDATPWEDADLDAIDIVMETV